MALYLVLLPLILAVSLASTEECTSPAASMLDLLVNGQKNSTGHCNKTVDPQRSTEKEDPQPLSASNETEQLVSVACVNPSLHGTLMSGTVQPHTASTSTATTITTDDPCSTITKTTTTNTYTISTSTSITTTTTTTPCDATIKPSPIITATTTTNSTTNTSSTTITTITTTPYVTISTTNSTTITTTTSHNIITPKSCPHSEYQLYPKFNCYKPFPVATKTWSDAREQCRGDGGDMMVMETVQEREEVYSSLYYSVVEGWASWPWVGVYLPEGADGWTTVKSEPALSTWWRPGLPDGNSAWRCAQADYNGMLGNYDCANKWAFICEIPF